jgi:hypothetical protein
MATPLPKVSRKHKGRQTRKIPDMADSIRAPAMEGPPRMNIKLLTRWEKEFSIDNISVSAQKADP